MTKAIPSASPIPANAHLMIIGAMKCGTTTLFDLLAQHPAICPSSVKEPEFFSGFRDAKSPVSRYEDLWNFDPARHVWALEGSVGYTKYAQEDVPARIQASGIRPRMIYLVRDPFARIESHYNFMRGDVTWRKSIDDPALVAASDYATHLDRFAAIFGQKAIQVLTLDDLRGAQSRTLAGLLDWLDLAPFEIDAPLRSNPTVAPPSALERRLLRAMPWLRGRMPAGVKKAALSLVPARRSRMQRLTDTQREAIHRELAPGMSRLAENWRIDVSGWGF